MRTIVKCLSVHSAWHRAGARGARVQARICREVFWERTAVGGRGCWDGTCSLLAATPQATCFAQCISAATPEHSPNSASALSAACTGVEPSRCSQAGAAWPSACARWCTKQALASSQASARRRVASRRRAMRSARFAATTLPAAPLDPLRSRSVVRKPCAVSICKTWGRDAQGGGVQGVGRRSQPGLRWGQQPAYAYTPQRVQRTAIPQHP